MPFRNVSALRGFTNAMLLEILNPTAALVNDARADVSMLSTYGSIEQPAGPPAGWTQKKWAAGAYWYVPFIFKPNTNAVIRSKLGTLVCDVSNYSIDRVFIASCGTIPKIYANRSDIRYRDTTANAEKIVDIRALLPNIMIQPWTSALEGIYVSDNVNNSANAASIRTWAQTAGNVFVNLNNPNSVLGYGIAYIDPINPILTWLLTANYTKPFLSGDSAAVSYTVTGYRYRTGSPTSGWTITNILKLTSGATDYYSCHYGRYGSAGGIVESLSYDSTPFWQCLLEAWLPVVIMQIPFYLGGYLADAYVEET